MRVLLLRHLVQLAYQNAIFGYQPYRILRDVNIKGSRETYSYLLTVWTAN